MRDDFFSSKLVSKGRKAYKCDQCRGVITAGSSHVCTSQRASGIISGQRLHIECAKLAGVMPAAAPAKGVTS